jgi:PAS domain S-box-containing protein
MPAKARLSIAAQLIIPFVIICVGLTLVLGASFFWKMNAGLNQALKEKCVILTRNCAASLVEPLVLGESPRMQQILLSMLKSDEDLRYIRFEDPQGKVFAMADPGLLCQPTSPAELKALIVGHPDGQIRWTADHHILEGIKYINVDDIGIGILRMGFSIERVESEIQSAEGIIAVVGAMALLLGIGIYTALIGRSIICPITNVADISTAVAEGHLSQPANVGRNDEIGDMLKAMNSMIAYLEDMSRTADAIASGNLDVEVGARSAADVFGTAFSKMVACLQQQRKELADTQRHVQNLAAIVQSSHEAIISADLNGRIVSWNLGAENLFHLSATQALAQPIESVFSSATMAKFQSVRSALQQNMVVDEFESEHIRTDGKRLDVSISASPVQSENGEVVAMSVIARDITDKKVVETRMKEFYSVISHELRTPLTSIRGGLGLIAAGIIQPDSAEGAELINMAKDNSLKLLRLINDILDLRKIEAGGLDLNLRRASCITLINSSVDSMRGLAGERGIKLSAKILTAQEVLADSDRIVQVLTNLISNAVKYSSPGGEVCVAVEPAEREGWMRFSVVDQGDGIPEELQFKLFGKFQQIDSSDSRSREGTGLGLAISKAIIEQHNGSIGVESAAGQGSAFWFEIAMPSYALNADFVTSKHSGLA